MLGGILLTMTIYYATWLQCKNLLVKNSHKKGYFFKIKKENKVLNAADGDCICIQYSRLYQVLMWYMIISRANWRHFFAWAVRSYRSANRAQLPPFPIKKMHCCRLLRWHDDAKKTHTRDNVGLILWGGPWPEYISHEC